MISLIVMSRASLTEAGEGLLPVVLNSTTEAWRVDDTSLSAQTSSIVGLEAHASMNLSSVSDDIAADTIAASSSDMIPLLAEFRNVFPDISMPENNCVFAAKSETIIQQPFAHVKWTHILSLP